MLSSWVTQLSLSGLGQSLAPLPQQDKYLTHQPFPVESAGWISLVKGPFCWTQTTSIADTGLSTGMKPQLGIMFKDTSNLA